MVTMILPKICSKVTAIVLSYKNTELAILTLEEQHQHFQCLKIRAQAHGRESMLNFLLLH